VPSFCCPSNSMSSLLSWRMPVPPRSASNLLVLESGRVHLLPCQAWAAAAAALCWTLKCDRGREHSLGAASSAYHTIRSLYLRTCTANMGVIIIPCRAGPGRGGVRYHAACAAVRRAAPPAGRHHREALLQKGAALPHPGAPKSLNPKKQEFLM
jgi:hypothetical protein